METGDRFVHARRWLAVRRAVRRARGERQTCAANPEGCGLLPMQRKSMPGMIPEREAPDSHPTRRPECRRTDEARAIATGLNGPATVRAASMKASAGGDSGRFAPSPSDEFLAVMKTDLERYKEIAKISGARLD